MEEIVIHNWDELQQIVFKDVWRDDIMRYRADMIYRGVGDDSYSMFPKLNRYCGHDLSLEDNLIRSFKKYGYSELSQYGDTFWQVLTIAQHHGLPTRLLDWSYSPLVAAHFATDEIEKYDCDGAVYCLNYSKLVSQIPQRIRDLLAKQHTSLCSLEILDEVIPDFEAMKQLQEDPYVLFFEPASIHNRVINQYALFSVVSDPAVSIEEIIERYPDDGFKIIIPKEVKLEIRDKLDYINISERMIYPGLDGICKWITRRYSDLGPIYNKKKDDE